MGAAVNTITKSGTNDLHGSLYYYVRNNNLDANNLLSAPGFNTLRFNQFGATVGGPIRKDNIFYFAGYEGQRRAQSPIYSHFILNCIDTEGCLGPGTPSINEIKTHLGLSPESLGSILEINDYNNAFGKFTDVLSDRNTLAAGYLFTDLHNGNTPAASPGQGLPSSYRDNRIHDQTVYANLFHLFQSREALTYTHEANSIQIGAEFEPIWFSAQTPYFTPGVGIFSPQSFFGAGPFSAFGPGTAVEFLFQQTRADFKNQVPQRNLPWENGFYDGPDGPARQAADAVAFWHKLAGVYA